MTRFSAPDTIRRWYVLRDLKRANALHPAHKSLAAEHIEVFTPMRWCLKEKNGKRQRELQPVIRDLLFAYAGRNELDPIIEKIPTLQYRFCKGTGYREPMFVANDDMQRFIQAVTATENPKYYLPVELTPAAYGQTVRIVGGPLDGCQGKLLRIRGSRVKRLLIEMPDFFTIGVEVAPEFVQIIDNDITPSSSKVRTGLRSARTLQG